MRLKRWFIVFIVVWAALTLPGLALGFAYAGGDLSAMVPDSSVQTIDLLVWTVQILWLFAPVILTPVGVKRRHTQS